MWEVTIVFWRALSVPPCGHYFVRLQLGLGNWSAYPVADEVCFVA